MGLDQDSGRGETWTLDRAHYLANLDVLCELGKTLVGRFPGRLVIQP